MLIRRWIFVYLFLTIATAVNALTVDELIAKNIEARGGLEKLRAIHSLRATGKIRFGGNAQFDVARLAKRPGMVRTEISNQGLTAIRAYDGEVGWNVSPFRGRKDPAKMSADDLKSMILTADMDGPLVDYKAKGNTVEYMGTEDVDGTDAHKLKVTLKDGDVRYIYLDPDYFLDIRWVDQTRIRGVQEEDETDVGNYEQYEGVYFPTSYESGPKGYPKDSKLTIDKVEVNVDLDDAIFHFPATPNSGK